MIPARSASNSSKRSLIPVKFLKLFAQESEDNSSIIFFVTEDNSEFLLIHFLSSTSVSKLIPDPLL